MEIDGLVGQRVSLRHRVGERDGRPLYSDAVGELAVDAGSVTVHARRGPVRVERGAVVAVRAVPPAPPRRASLTAIARIENLCADAWPAEVDEPLGGWRLRAAGGYTGRANSALAIGNPGMPVAEALRTVQAFADRHGIAPKAQVPMGSPWDRAVAAEGWVLDEAHAAGPESAVLVAALPTLTAPLTTALPTTGRAALSSEPMGRMCRSSDGAEAGGGEVGGGEAGRVEVGLRPTPEWWAVAGHDPSGARRRVLDPAGGGLIAFPVVRGPGGEPLGALRAAVVEDHLHLSVIEVVPSARRRGLATELLHAAAAWGQEHGARWGVLQVALHNSGARALYDRLGFVEHHRYRYLVPSSRSSA